MEKYCFMFGHRDAPESVLSAIERAVEAHYQKYGIREFVVGNRGSFDHLAARAVRMVKARHPQIRLTLLLAYHPGERTQETAGGFDDTLYPDGMENVPKRLSIVRANRKAAAQAQSMICYVCRPGNARELMEYALKSTEKVHIENVV